jgi:hypothetical protein
MNGGTISSLRWIDVLKGGRVQGKGNIETSLYNAGKTSVAGILKVNGLYHEQPTAVLEFVQLRAQGTELSVDGNVYLAGTLKVTVDKTFKPASGDKITLLTAGNITGTFANDDDQVKAGGTFFDIDYSDKAVALIAQ